MEGEEGLARWRRECEFCGVCEVVPFPGVCEQGMRKLYTDCHLVHADLSEYNMLWHRGEVVFIDVGQSVEPSHPYGLEFLFRDCLNVSRFFSQRWPAGKGGVMGAQELFNYVTRMGLTASSDEEFRVQVGVV